MKKPFQKEKKLLSVNLGDQHFVKTLTPKILYSCYVPGHIRWEMTYIIFPYFTIFSILFGSKMKICFKYNGLFQKKNRARRKGNSPFYYNHPKF